MSLPKVIRWARRSNSALGFSLLEMLVSVSIIILLMSAVFPFIFQAQKRFQGNVVVSESNQSARAALEVMTQEIGQAGFNPTFYPNKTSTTVVTANADPQCITLNNITGIHPGDWVTVDTGVSYEIVQVTSTSAAAASPCGAANQIKGIFTVCHNNNTAPCPAGGPLGAFSVASYKMPFGAGILQNTGTSNDQRLEFYGDINQDETVNYVVYSISPMVPTTTVCIPAVAAGATCAAANTYILYNLYRSITPVPFPALGTTFTPPANNIASPMVEKVLYNTTTSLGPTGQGIFAYPSQILVGVIPNQVTVVGTIVITLCVAVNPTSLETNQVIWSTMATQIRPLNLQAAVNVNNSGGGKYLSLLPASLPMTFPTGYYP